MARAGLFYTPRVESVTIAHISDIHCGGGYFVPDLMERAIADINALEPDIVVCSGDLTTFGFKEEYAQAKRYLDRIDCESFVVVPGNHDSRNVGYVHFEELFGARNSVLRKNRPCYNLVEANGSHVDVWRCYPFHGRERIIQFNLETLEYEKYTGKIEREVSSQR